MSGKPRISIGELLDVKSSAMGMRLLAGKAGIDRVIEHPRMQKPSLAFAGFIEYLDDCRLQVIGRTELHYLATRPEVEQKRVVDALFDQRLAGVVVTRGLQPPPLLIEAAERTGTPLISTELESYTFITQMMLFLSRRLAPVGYQHGVYLDIFGLGVLLTGASGSGKSEIGLELISRGHRLIADDMVEFVKQGPDVIVGRSPEALRFHMEIRGLGILNIRDLYGAAAITDAKRLSLVVELVPYEELSDGDRVVDEEATINIQGVPMPRVRVPIRSGRSLAVLIEVATRNQLLKKRGIDSGKEFVRSLEERIRQRGDG
ncbi:MAG TPA: HPr(Ser) kinase/phosphatase [Mariprofundaceae bacterium]|nr:HPr(Ser) kinase/phosphatase [Mariprofundaceae bacterium]